MKTVVKILAVVGSLLVVGVLVIAVLGFVAYRNLYPALDKTEAAEMIGKFKLRKAFPVKGNIWGTTTNYFLEYETDNGGKKNALTYSLRKFWSESGAVDDFKKTECSRSDLAKEGVIKNKNGNAVGDFRYCSGTLHFRNGARSATVYTFVIGNNDYAPDSVVIDFVKSLTINADVDFASFAPAYPSMLTESKNASTTTSTNGSLSVFEIVRQQKQAGGSAESSYDGQTLTARGYIYSAPSDAVSAGKGFAILYDREDISSPDAVKVTCWFDKSEQSGFGNLKGKQYITVKGVLEVSDAYLNECELVSAE